MTQASPDFLKPEIITIQTDNVACDGGGGPIGHPRVFLTVNRHTGQVDCPYCDRQFVLKGGAHAATH